MTYINKEKSRSPKRHDFLLNFNRSPPLSVDQFEFLSVQPHSKDSVNDHDDQHSFHYDRLMTATDYLHGKQHALPSYFPYSKKTHLKKKSFDQPKDSVTYHQSTPSTTTNAKSINKSSISRASTRPNPSQHTNFLNSKEFAKFALSKVLPRDIKRERGIQIELSPPSRDSKAASLEKRSPKTILKEDALKQSKLSALQAKKVKQRASNLTSHDFSSLLDQTRHIQSFINSPQRRNPVQMYLPSTKSTANLRPMTTKNTSNNNNKQNTWQYTSIDGFKRLDTVQYKKAPSHHYIPSSEDARPQDRNKGMQSIASILNLRREHQVSPEKKVNSCYPASNYHRKVASIGGGGAQNSACSQSTNYPPNSHHPISQTASIHGDYKSSAARSESHATKSSLSPSKRDPSSAKAKIEEEGRIILQGINTEHFMKLQKTFESLLEKYKNDIHNAQDSYNMLKQIKEAYESFTTELFSRLASQRGSVVSQDGSYKERCDTLEREKREMEETIKALRAENHRLYSLVSERRDRERPDISMREESKGSEEDNLSHLFANRNTEKRHDEYEDLKKIVISQQGMINELRNKEAKLMQLIYSIHKRGFDVEKLINEEASRGSEHFEQNSSHSSKQHFDSRKEMSERENPLDTSEKDIGSIVTLGELSGKLLFYLINNFFL